MDLNKKILKIILTYQVNKLMEELKCLVCYWEFYIDFIKMVSFMNIQVVIQDSRNIQKITQI